MLIKSLLQWTSGLKSKEVREETRCFSGSAWLRIWSPNNPKEWLKLTSLQEDTFSALKKTGNGVDVKGCNSIWNRANKCICPESSLIPPEMNEWVNGWWCCFATTRYREKKEKASAEPVRNSWEYLSLCQAFLVCIMTPSGGIQETGSKREINIVSFIFQNKSVIK